MKEERTLTNCKRIGNHLILLDKLLGSGHYGKVYLSYEISQADDKSLLMNKPLACKIIEREKLSATAHKQVQNEVEVLSEVKSDNVIFMNNSYKTHSRYYIFTELCNGGDLLMLKNAKGSLSEEDCRLILKQLVKGLRDLFDYDLVHRDIKLANILLHFNIPDQLKISGDRYITQDDFLTMDQKDKLNFLKMVDLQSVNFQVKIADFGFSKFLDTKSQRSDTMCGTPLYMAPQLVEDIKYTYKADIWSLGVIFFELLTGSHPFNGRNLEQLGKNLNQGEYALEVVHKPSVECLRIITGCLQYDEDERSNIIDISNSEYFTEGYAPREIPNSFFVNRKGSNPLRNSSADIYQRKSSLNQNNNGKYKMILNSKDSWLLRRLEMSMTTLTPSPKFSEIQQVERKQQNNFKTLQINTSSPNEFNCELAPQLITPFQKIKSPKIENFVLTEGQILEASQYLIARDNEFTKITSSKVLMEDYFSFQ